MKENIGAVIAHYDKHGKSSRELLEGLGFKSDGDEDLRDKNGDHLQRAIIMNHPAVKAKRDEEESKNRQVL